MTKLNYWSSHQTALWDSPSETYDKLVKFNTILKQEQKLNPDIVLALVSHSLVGDVLTAEWKTEPEDSSISLPENFIRINNGQFVSADTYFSQLI